MLAAKQKFLFVALAYFLIGLSGCASVPVQGPEKQVRSRAQAWLDALMDFDIDGIYRFTSPAYQSAHSARFYSKNYAGRNMWRTAELGEISCDQAVQLLCGSGTGAALGAALVQQLWKNHQ